MLLTVNACRQAGLVIVLQHRYGCLGQNWPRVQFLCDEMDGATGNANLGPESLADGIQTPEAW